MAHVNDSRCFNASGGIQLFGLQRYVSSPHTTFGLLTLVGGLREFLFEFQVSTTIITLGVSLFVLGFAIGPLLWAPLSELYGRQVIFFITYGAFTAFNAGAAGAQNITTLLILRFLAGAFGSSPLTNAGGVIADIFSASERGLAMAAFALAPFLGPTIGPIVGGFVGENVGWRWIEAVMAIASGVLWIAASLLVPETFAPVLLKARAAKLSKMTDAVYKSPAEISNQALSPTKIFSTSISRPLVLLFAEPIVLLLSIYMAIIYGTLYMLFGAYPIVFQQHRSWSEGRGGLAFIGVALGMIVAWLIMFSGNKSYVHRAAKAPGGRLPPEERLKTGMLGAVAVPIGLFWFAWTNDPSIHWISPIAAGAPFGFGMVLIFLAITNYLIDTYTIYAASVLAANSVLRSLFGFAFPLFTRDMYEKLGIHWASSIPAFLALACVPMPFMFYKYGPAIRMKCRYAAESEEFMTKVNVVQVKETSRPRADSMSSLERVATVPTTYSGNPYDIDRVNTAPSLRPVLTSGTA